MAELIGTEALENYVHFIDVLGALDIERHAAAFPDAVATNQAWVACYGTGVPELLAAMAAELGITQRELIIEAHRQAVASFERRTTERGREIAQAAVDDLADELARHE